MPFNSLERVPFETELFEGEIVLNMAGLGPAPPPAWAGACVGVLGLGVVKGFEFGLLLDDGGWGGSDEGRRG